MKHIALLFVLVMTGMAMNGQSIKGTLMDPVEGSTVAGATVQLQNAADSSIKASALSDKEGKFSFGNLSLGAYILKATSIGFETFEQAITLSDTLRDADLEDVYIPKKTTTLEGVVIVATAPAVTQKGDTTQFSANQYKTNPDATVEDLIKKMPGITVDKDGTVTGHGEQVKKVTVDGKDFFGDDASMALKNLPAEVVDKIQLYDRMSDQAQLTGFDDGNTAKAINIVTKSGLRNGQFGRIFAGYGTDNRYYGGGNASFFNGSRRITLLGNFNNINQQNFAQQDVLGVMSSGGRGGGNRGGGGRGGGGFGSGPLNVGQSPGISQTNAFGINFSDQLGKKVSITASYDFRNSTNNNESFTFSPTVTEDKRTLNLSTNNRSTSNNNMHRINMRLEYKIDSNNTIMYIPSWTFQNNSSTSSTYKTAIYESGDSSYISDGNSRSNRSGYSLGNNLMYRHSFRKPGRTFSTFLQANFSKNDGDSYNLTNLQKFENINLPDVRNQYRKNPTNGANYSARINYTEPIGQQGIMELSYSPGLRINKRDQKTFDYDGIDYTLFNPGQSNNFKSTITTHTGSANYRLGKGRDNQFSAGFDVQYSDLKSDRIYPSPVKTSQDFVAFLPNLRWSKKISNYSSFRAYYRANTDFPSVDQLQDVADSSSQTNIIKGNPNLKQSYSHWGSFRYIYANTRKGNSFAANFSYSAAQNYITSDVVNNKGITNTTYINLNGYQNFNSFLVYAFPIKYIKSNFSITGSYNYSNTPSKYNNVVGKVARNTLGSGISLSSNISQYVDFTLRYDLNYTQTASTLENAASGQNYIQQSPSLALNLLSENGWFINTNLSYEGFNFTNNSAKGTYYTLWNAAAGKKFLAKKQAELKLSVFDILKQNNSFSQSLNDYNLIQTTTTKVLRQYFMLTFTYSLRNFGKGKAPAREDGEERRREWQGGPPGMMRGGGRQGGPMF
ncbi:TonB-dependent receptor [Niabella sp.]|uniref:TonB-dependent receptor n=1 Tax=Niabella sp. TaxID=1962976 RepID=UPI002625DBC6|nr:TonB-dependent receptor [Niabella sp.]